MLINNMIAPTFIPQISDPRINIQTFNAPNNPILPNVLPVPHSQMTIKMPDNEIKTKDVYLIDDYRYFNKMDSI